MALGPSERGRVTVGGRVFLSVGGSVVSAALLSTLLSSIALRTSVLVTVITVLLRADILGLEVIIKPLGNSSLVPTVREVVLVKEEAK